MPVSSRTSRPAVSSGVSPRLMPPLGSAVIRRRPTGVITSTSSPRTATPPYEVSVTFARPRRSVDIALEGGGIVDGQPAASLRDHPGALEHGEEAAGRLGRGAGELRELRLRRGEEDIALAGALGPCLLDELGEHGGDAALDGLERLPSEPLVGGAQPAAEGDHELDGDVRVAGEQRAHVDARDAEDVEVVDRLDRRRAPL